MAPVYQERSILDNIDDAEAVRKEIRLSELLQEAEDIRDGVRPAITFELPPQREPVAPRTINAGATKDPVRPAVFQREEIARTWENRLDRLTNFQARLRENPRWQEVERRKFAREDALCQGLFLSADPRREVFIRLAAYLSDEEMRVCLLADIDHTTQEESDALVGQAIENGGTLAGFPLMVLGTGMHGTNAALVLQAFANGKALQIDAHPRRGGLFRTFSPFATFPFPQFRDRAEGPDIAAFDLNSRDNRRQVADFRSRAGGRQNLNPFTDEAAIQLPAFDFSSYPPNNLLAAAIAVNSYLAGPALVGARVIAVWENARKTSEQDALLVRVQVGETAVTIPVFGGELAPGLGAFTIPNPKNDARMAQIIRESREQLQAYMTRASDQLPKVITGQQFLQMVVARPGDVFHQLVESVVVVAGKKDTAQIVLACLLGDAPDRRVYGDYVPQEGGPNALYWVGPAARNRKKLRKELKLRPRYSKILVDYPRSEEDGNAALTPLSGRVVGFNTVRGFRQDILNIEVGRPDGTSDDITDADLLILCTGQINDQTTELLTTLTRFTPLRVVVDEEGTPVFREVANDHYAGRMLLVGPASALRVSDTEKEESPALARVKENSVAIWLNTEKVVLASRELARRYNQARFEEEVEKIPF